jgi:hypothetical protein
MRLLGAGIAVTGYLLVLGPTGTNALSGLEVLENVVARDGLEPPTPAFSGLRSTN